MTNERTIEKLRNEKNYDKVYVYLSNESICKKFLEQAESEGYMFGTIKPTENHTSDIIAIEDGKKLAYVSSIGRMAYQSGKVDRIDYEKYIHGEEHYHF